MVYCSGLENLAGKASETAESQHFCGSQGAQVAPFTGRSAGRVGNKVGTPPRRIRERVAARRDAWVERRAHYRNATAFIPNDGNTREPGNFKVLKNYATTIIDEWMDRGEFSPREVYAISLCRDYWHALDEAAYERKSLRGFVPTKAFIATLHKIKAMAARVPLWQWLIFENVVRWDEPTGIPGSKFARLTPTSVAAAKRIVSEVARCLAP